VDENGKVTGANGWLSTPKQADTYPLVSAREAFDALPSVPRMMMCPVSPEGGCKEPAPAEITGAHLGLSLQPLAAGGQILVPAWLFDVKGSTDPVAGVAVEPRFLASDEPTGRPTVGPSPGPSDNPGSPTQVEPPAPARSPLSFDSAYRAKIPNAVVVQYGDSSSCPHQNVTHAVKESATSVVVVLEADPMNTLVACTDNYLAKKVEVALQAPLGDRKVIDGTSGREIPLS